MAFLVNDATLSAEIDTSTELSQLYAPVDRLRDVRTDGNEGRRTVERPDIESLVALEHAQLAILGHAVLLDLSDTSARLPNGEAIVCPPS